MNSPILQARFTKVAEADVFYGGTPEEGGLALNYADADHEAEYDGLGTDGTCKICGKAVLFDGFGPGDPLDPNTETKWKHIVSASKTATMPSGVGHWTCIYPECRKEYSTQMGYEKHLDAEHGGKQPHVRPNRPGKAPHVVSPGSYVSPRYESARKTADAADGDDWDDIDWRNYEVGFEDGQAGKDLSDEPDHGQPYMDGYYDGQMDWQQNIMTSNRKTSALWKILFDADGNPPAVGDTFEDDGATWTVTAVNDLTVQLSGSNGYTTSVQRPSRGPDQKPLKGFPWSNPEDIDEYYEASRSKESGMTSNREAQILEAMKSASLTEQKVLVQELDNIRSTASRQAQADRDWDMASEIVADHLTPVLVHGMHSTATDWLEDAQPEYKQADLRAISNAVRTEASLWYRRTSAAVREDRQELLEQARGMAARTSGKYGELSGEAQGQFLDYVAHLHRTATGTDIAGVPSAAGDGTNPETTAWSEQPSETPADSGPQTAPDGIDANPQPPSPEGSGDEPSDTAPSSVSTVDPESTFDTTTNAATGTGAPGPMQETTAAYSCPSCKTKDPGKFRGDHCRICGWKKGGGHFQESSLKARAHQIFAVEEGQAFPVPGEVDTEQSGEAGSSLPVGVDVASHPDSLDNFVPKTPAKPAPSTRAPNVARRRTADSQPPWLKSDDDDSKKDDDDWKPVDSDNYADFDDKKDDSKTSRRRTAVNSLSEIDTSAPATDVYDEALEYFMSQGKSMDEAAEAADNWTSTHLSSRHNAVAVTPNPQGSKVYDPIEVTAKGYEEGFVFGLSWEPGRPIPAAMTSAASIGHQYNAEYVVGYQNGVQDAIAKLDKTAQDVWNREVASAVVLASKEAALPQLELSAMDDTVSDPYTWKDGGNSVDGKGAADVASAPTPGASVADYPQPGNSKAEPAVGMGEEPVEDWVTKAEAVVRRRAAFDGDECFGCGYKGPDWKGGGFNLQCPKCCGSYEIHQPDAGKNWGKK